MTCADLMLREMMLEVDLLLRSSVARCFSIPLLGAPTSFSLVLLTLGSCVHKCVNNK